MKISIELDASNPVDARIFAQMGALFATRYPEPAPPVAGRSPVDEAAAVLADKPKRAKKEKTESVPDSKDPAQLTASAIAGDDGMAEPPAIDDIALKTLFVQYANKVGTEKAQAFAATYNVRRIFDITGPQRAEAVTKMRAELGA